MAKQVTVNEIENIIKEKLKSSGAAMSDELVSRIKESILQKYNKEKSTNEADEPVDVDISSEPTPTEQDVPTPGAVQTEKQNDITYKEQELQQKEEELSAKEQELQQKEEELKYKPQLPIPLKEVGKEEFFVFDENQISLGGEGLSNAQLYLKNNPEVKSSMNGEWINKGMTRADLYIVEYKKIGELTFNPFDGTTKLEKYTAPAEIKSSTPIGFPIETTTVSDDNSSSDDIFDEIIKDKIEKYFTNKFK